MAKSKKPRGRPPLGPNIARTGMVKAYLTVSEMARVKALADDQRISTSELVRRSVLGAMPTP